MLIGGVTICPGLSGTIPDFTGRSQPGGEIAGTRGTVQWGGGVAWYTRQESAFATACLVHHAAPPPPLLQQHR